MRTKDFLDLDSEAFSSRKELKRHIAWESFVCLAARPWRKFVVDYTAQRREMKAGFLLALSFGLSQQIQQITDRKRVGILFPPGIGGFIANLAVFLSGKIPVNLNFTLGRSAAESCIAKSELNCILTANPLLEKFPDFPWQKAAVLDVVDALKALPKARILILMLSAYVLPARVLARLLKIPKFGGDTEAALLFTSGSSGDPKGVVLTHRNILGNCAQIDATKVLPSSESILANLPIFHSFGFTASLCYPLLRRCQVVTVASPLEVKRAIEAIEAEGISIMLGTPTFLKPYFKKASPDQLRTLKWVVAGAEKTPDGFAESWEAHFKSRYFQGYGLTETSPVVSVNLPEIPAGFNYPGDSREGARTGSVGRLLPGHAATVLDPDTKARLELGSVGLLALKGPNVFSGYLGEAEKTETVFHEGWFLTGDLARIDADGFIFIEGRLSRFSKIGGEMVPHGTVEERIIELFGFEDAEFPVVAVAGRPDENKGEALILLAAVDIDLTAVRSRLFEEGLSNLWIPKELIEVTEIPTLPTGKLDLRRISEIALAGSE